MSDTPVVLGIETSCDETGLGVVAGTELRSNVLASQVDIHARFGGVVPEVAARAHVEAMRHLAHRALSEAGVHQSDLDGIAATQGPGLVGALVVGFTFAKSLAWALGKPFIGVNHMEGHLFAPLLGDPGFRPAGRRLARLGWSQPGCPYEGLGRLRDPRRDHRRRGRRGPRQDRPIPRAWLPGRPGHRSGGRERRPDRHRLPPGLAGPAHTTSPSPVSRPHSSPTCGSTGTPAPSRRFRMWLLRCRRQLSTCWSPRRSTPSMPPASRWSAAGEGSWPTRRLRARLQEEADRARGHVVRPAPRSLHRQRRHDRRRRRPQTRPRRGQRLRRRRGCRALACVRAQSPSPSHRP